MNQGRTHKAIKNVFYNILNQLVNLILAFISRTVFIWGFGVSYLGLNSLFIDVLGLLSLADLGMNTAMVFSYYKPLADKDYEKIAGLTTFYKKIYIVIATTITILGLAIIPILPYIIHLNEDIPYLNYIYILSLSNIVFSYICVYKTSILTADQKAYKVTKITMLMNFVRTIAQILVILFTKNYILYLIIGSITVLLTNIFSSRIAEKEYPIIQQKSELGTEDKKELINNVSSTFIYKLSSALISTTDNIIISIVVGTIAVGYYSNYLLIQNKITLLYALVFSSITASIGNLVVNENKQKRYEVFSCEQTISFIVCSLVVPCFMLLVNDFIKLWLGENFLFSNLTVLAIGANMYLSCIFQPLWSYREATGLYKKTKWIMTLCALVNIILSFALGYCLGVSGVLLATSISKLMTYFWYEPKLLFTEYFGKESFIYYKNLMINFLITLLIYFIGLYISKFFIISSWIYWLLEAFTIGMISLILIYIFYRKSQGFIILKNKVKSLIKN